MARKLVYMAIRGNLAALVEIRTATEGNKLSADFNFPEAGTVPPLIELCFVSSDGNGYPAPGQMIDSHAVPELPAQVTD